MKNIIVATDFSEIADRALVWALDLARVFGAKITLVHAIEPLSMGAPANMVAEFGQITATIVTGAQRGISNLVEKHKASGVPIEAMIREGHAADEIVKAAEDVKADLIVVGTHGRRGVAHVLLGSVAERVVRTAKCPVTTLGRSA